MITLHDDVETAPPRVLVLGGGGFVGGAIARALRARGARVVRLTRRDIDLEGPSAADALARELRETDHVVFAAARAPARTAADRDANLAMVASVGAALTRRPCAHLLNIGSDAIYADADEPLTEGSLAAPTTIHGETHAERERLLDAACPSAPIAHLRPSLIYGVDDPHNGYGPNRFRRQAEAGEAIVLFGGGEERRDHVMVDDVAELAARMCLRRASGALNAATGSVTSFADIAETVSALHASPEGRRAPIVSTPRSGPMPHNGWRAFDPAATAAAFPDFDYAPLADGLRRVRDACRRQAAA